jgi:hypothetical protein
MCYNLTITANCIHTMPQQIKLFANKGQQLLTEARRNFFINQPKGTDLSTVFNALVQVLNTIPCILSQSPGSVSFIDYI